MAITRPDGPLNLLLSQLSATWDSIDTALLGTGFWLNVKSFGALGDGVTDDTAAIQAAIDFLDTNNESGTIFFPVGIYLIDGAFLDTSHSNSQILLPRRSSSATSMISILLKGAAPAPTYAVKRNKGTVIKSTKTSGTGSVIGGKVSSGAWPVTGNSWCTVHVKDITIRTEPDSINGLDLFYYPNSKVKDCQVSTDEDVIASPTDPPTYGITEPTNGTYGIRLAPNNLPDQCALDTVQIYGYETGLLSGELVKADNVIVIFCKTAVEIPAALHKQTFRDLYVGDCETALKFTGGNSNVDIDIDIEHSAASPAWAAVTLDVDDPNHYAHGILRYHISENGAVGYKLLRNGGFYLWPESLGAIADTYPISPYVRAHRTTNQTFTTSTFTNITFNANDSPTPDPFDIHSTSSNSDRFIPPFAGKVRIKCTGRWASNATGLRQLVAYKHSAAAGGIEIVLDRVNEPAISGADKTINVLIESRATLPDDYFYFKGWQSSGVDLDLVSSVALDALDLSSPVVEFSMSR